MNNPIKILITGDTHLGGGRVKELAIREAKDQLFGKFSQLIQKADISITNLESPLVDNGSPILKTGPNLKSPISSLGVLKKAGFDLLTLANNHIMDYGEAGLASTLDICSRTGLKTVGVGQNFIDAQQPFTTEIQGLRISIINIAENEFGTTENESPGAHSLNPIQNYYRIKETSETSDYVLVIIHGGHENYQLPSPRMKDTYRFFVDAGASAVIGHHPHCYSGYEVYRNVPIFYSLGNFLFDKQNQDYSIWNEGIMVEFIVDDSGLDFEIIPYIQNDKDVGLRRLNQEERSFFDKKLSQLNKIISDKRELEKNFEEFCISKRDLYSNFIEPHSFKYIHALRNRNLFPSLLSKRKKRLLLNLTRCEAHRDILQQILKL